MAQKVPPHLSHIWASTGLTLEGNSSVFAVWQALLPSRRHHVLVATSGGPDSMVALHLACLWRDRLGIKQVTAVGINHGLRPEAAGELALARDLAIAYGASFVAVDVAVSPSGNMMAQARRARYRALAGVLRARAGDVVLLGHTADDQAETLMFQLARGQGSASSIGIVPRRGAIVRPLLGTGRAAILEHLNGHGIAYATDPTNAKERFSRSQIRAHVLPPLCRVHADAKAHVSRFCEQAQVEGHLLWRLARKAAAASAVSGGGLCLTRVARRHRALWPRIALVWVLARGLPQSRRVVEAIVALLQLCRTGRMPSTFKIAVARGALMLTHDVLWALTLDDLPPRRPLDGRPRQCRVALLAQRRPLTVPGRLNADSLKETFIEAETLAWPPDADGPLGRFDTPRALPKHLVAFAADHRQFDLTLRPWHGDDTILPFGWGRPVRVKDILAQAKVPAPLRKEWPVLEAAGEIIWVVGLKRGQCDTITANTKACLLIRAHGAWAHGPW